MDDSDDKLRERMQEFREEQRKLEVDAAEVAKLVDDHNSGMHAESQKAMDPANHPPDNQPQKEGCRGWFTGMIAVFLILIVAFATEWVSS
jgi:hypothetical protein